MIVVTFCYIVMKLFESILGCDYKTPNQETAQTAPSGEINNGTSFYKMNGINVFYLLYLLT